MSRTVFINCPYDRKYTDFFKIIVYFCAYFNCEAHFACEISGAIGRIDKIINLINSCEYGIHDISNVSLSKDTKLPRFNMPFELGIDYMSKSKKKQTSQILVLDGRNKNYEKCLSDLKGSDIEAHEHKEEVLAKLLRDFFVSQLKLKDVLSPSEILNSYKIRFGSWLHEELDKKGFGNNSSIEMHEFKTIVEKYFKESNSVARPVSS